MTDQDTTYYLRYDKFRLLYIAYAPLCGYLFWGLKFTDWLLITLLCIILLILLSRLFFWKILQPSTAITLTKEGVTTYGLIDKAPQTIPYSRLLGPFEENLMVIKRITIRDAEDEENQIIFTDLTENVQELMDEIKRHTNAENKST